MRLFLILLCIEGVVSTSNRGKGFITRGEYHFIGPDKGLTHEMARRMTAPQYKARSVGRNMIELSVAKIPPPMDSVPYPVMELMPFERLTSFDLRYDMPERRFGKPKQQSRRANQQSGKPKPQPGSAIQKSGKAKLGSGNAEPRVDDSPFNSDVLYRRHAYKEGDTDTALLGAEQMKSVETSVYVVQTKLRQVDWILKKYSDDPRYRMAYIFMKLEEWQRDIHIYIDYTSYSDYWIHRQRPPNYTAYWHMIYLGHIVRKSIDVTYTIDYLLELHNHQQRLAKEVTKDLKAQVPGLDGL